MNKAQTLLRSDGAFLSFLQGFYKVPSSPSRRSSFAGSFLLFFLVLPSFLLATGPTSVSSNTAPPDEVVVVSSLGCENFLGNPEFDYGTTRWSLANSSGNTSSWSVNTGSQLSGANSAFIDIGTATGGSANAKKIQFYQAGYVLYSGMTYTVTFQAKALANRNINVSLQQVASPYTTYANQTVAITTTKTTYTLTFPVSTNDLNGAGLYFNLGESTTDLYLDNVVFAEQCGLQACVNGTGHNIVSNSEMDNALGNWNLSVQGGASATSSVVTTSQLSGANSAFVNIATATGTNWHVQFYQAGHTVKAGTTYRVTFKAKATANRNMYVSLQQNYSPWSEIDGQTVSLTTASKTFTLDFLANQTDDNDIGLFFHLGESNADVYIDDVDWAELCNTEICNNGYDDDGDGKIDGADPDCSVCDAPTYGFQNGTLVSGTALSPGAVYLFQNVTPGTDVRVKINSFSHSDVQISNIDLSAYDAPGGYNLSFQPQVLYGWNNGNGTFDPTGERFVNFTFSFYDAGTMNPQEVNKLVLSAIDVDGDNGSIMEFIESTGFSAYETNSPTALTLSGSLKAKSNISNATNIDETALDHMISYTYNNKTSITVKYGADWNGASNNFADNRLNSLFFKCYSLNTQVACPTVTVQGNYSVCMGVSQELKSNLQGGSGSKTFQWQMSLDNQTWTNIAGATTDKYTTPALTVKTYYRLGVSWAGNASCGIIYSDDFPVTPVLCLENCSNGVDDNGNGLVDGADLDCVTLCPTGNVTYQRWLNIGGTAITDLTGNASYPNTPTETGTLTSLDGPDNIADNYGTRIRGYITPSASGNYVFNLTSDDAGQFFLSSNADPANKVLVASVTGWTNQTEYNKYSSQTSSPFNLLKDRNYYFEILQKEGGGLDHFQVNWKTPSNTNWAIVPGANLRPYNCSEICGNTLDDDGNGLTDCAETACQPTISTQPSNSTICSGGTYSLSVTASGSATYQWQSSTNNSTFTNISGATSSSYTTPALTATTYYRVIVTVSGCPKTSNAATVTVVADPTITAQPASATICSGGTQSLSVTATGGTPSLTYQWQSSTDNATFTNISGATSSSYTTPTLSSTMYYKVIVSASGNGCGAATSSVAMVTVAAAPTITAQPASATICSGGTQSLSVTATGSSLTYQWQTSTNNSTFTNISGATSSSYATPVLTATTYFRVLVSTLGTGCATSTSTAATITVVASPTITAQPTSGIVCSGGTQTLSVTATGGTPSLSYQWQSSTDNSTFTNISGATSSSYTTSALTSTTYYKVIVSASGNGCASTTSSVATVTVVASPSITAQPAGATICSGGTHSLSVTATGGTPSLTYQWQSSTNNSTFTNISGATSSSYATPALTVTTYYRVLVSASGSGCATATSAAATVTVAADPTITTQPASTTICSGLTTTLSVVATGGTPSLTYQWQSSLTGTLLWTNISGATSSSYTTPALSLTSYYRVIVSASGSDCASVTSNVATVTMGVSLTPTITGNTTICNGSNTILTAVGVGTFVWSTGATTANLSVAPTATTTYTVTLTNATGCSGTAQATVTVNPLPTPNAGVDATVCAGTSTTLTATGGTSYAWSNGLGTGASKSVSPITTTTYTVTVTNANGCTATDQVVVNVNARPAASAGSNITICKNSSTTLTASATGGITPYTYVWSNSLGSNPTISVTPTSTTTYTVTVTGSNGCSSTSAVTVTVNALPTANAGADVTICTVGITTLTAVGSGAPSPYSYIWSNGSTLPTQAVSPGVTTTYTVTVTSSNGCFGTDQVVVTAQPCVENCSNGFDDDGDGKVDCTDSDCGPLADAGTDMSVCPGTTAFLNVGVTGGIMPYTYVWSNGLGTGATKTVSPLVTTTYSVTVTSATGCTSVDQVKVTVLACTENCTNGIDDNGNGLVDCADPSCAGVTAPLLMNDNYTTCPGIPYSNRVTYNDGNLNNPLITIAVQPTHGTVTIDWTGKFVYTPNSFECLTDHFTYQICNQSSGCCATAVVNITMGDNTQPTLVNVPADLTISCDDAIPNAPLVTGFDQCPGIYLDYDEVSNQNFVGACGSYTITRTWKATDFCGNTVSDDQVITVVDQTKPELFRLYTLEGGAKMVAGFAQRVTHDWKYVRFPITFKAPPVVLASISTNVDASAVVTQVRNVSMQGFEVRLREEEAADGKHGLENVSWVAVDADSHNGNLKWEAGTLANVNDTLSPLAFKQAFSQAPLFFSSSTTNIQDDPATLRHFNLTSTGVEVFAQEEQSAGTETTRVNETVAYMAMNTGAPVLDKDGEEFGETGKLNVTNAWATVNLTRKYTKPVLILGGLTNNDNQAVTLRVRNLASKKFEVRLQEWNYLDGNHPSEAISWMVVEGGVPGNQSFYCNGKAGILKPNVNIFAVDNCDDLVNFAYDELSSETGQGLIQNHTWTAIDDCGNTTLISRIDTCQVAALKLKALIYGPLQGNSGSNLTVMRDNLREQTIIPTIEPYTSMPAFPYVNYEIHENNGNGDNGNTGTTGTGPIVEICHETANGQWETKSVYTSELPYYVSIGDQIGACGGIDPLKITICHNPGANDQKTKVITKDKLLSHLAHGDLIGSCSGGSGNAGAAPTQYLTIADGLWSDPAVWLGGSVPPDGDISNKTIGIVHKITVSDSDLKFKNGSKLYVIAGSLTLNKKNIEVQDAAVYFDRSVLDMSTADNFKLTKSNSVAKFTDCIVKIGHDLTQDNGGILKMERVQLDVDGKFENKLGSDTLINVCANFKKEFKNRLLSKLYISKSSLRLEDGDFTNEGTVTGGDIKLLIEHGKLQNIGLLWSAPLLQYCVSGSIGLPISILPVLEDCSNISTVFSSCTCDDGVENTSTVGSGTTGVVSNIINTVNLGNSYGDGEIDDPAILNVTGTNAIVDWVLVELRNMNNDAEVLGYQSVMLERDGHIIGENGDSVLVFPGLEEGDYYVSIRHRNHLGLTTNTPIFLSIVDPPLIDFTDPIVPVKGGASSGKLNGGKRTLWGGDLNGDGKVIYQGPNNDVFRLFSKIISNPDNATNLANYIVPGYEGSDYNLDGMSIYQGPNNDRSYLLLYSILSHPGNFALLANYIALDFIP